MLLDDLYKIASNMPQPFNQKDVDDLLAILSDPTKKLELLRGIKTDLDSFLVKEKISNKKMELDEKDQGLIAMLRKKIFKF